MQLRNLTMLSSPRIRLRGMQPKRTLFYREERRHSHRSVFFLAGH